MIKSLFSNPMAWAVLAVAGLFFTWGIGRQVNKFFEPPKPPTERLYTVQAVTSGASIEVVGRRAQPILLKDVSAPAEGSPFAEQSRANLAKLAGARIRTETPHRGIFPIRGGEDEGQAGRLLGDAGQHEEQPDDSPGAEARGPVVCVAYAESGGCLNLGQVMDGWVSCLPSAPAEWRKQEASAKKAKIGMWGKK